MQRKILSLLLITSILLSSCLVNSRIGYHQQEETKNDIFIKESDALLIFSARLSEKKNVEDLIKRLSNLKLNIDSRSKATKMGITIPAYIDPTEIDNQLDYLNASSPYDYLIIVDGYPMPTEYNGGNLVSAIIEVWDIKKKDLKYNSHSTIKSKQRNVNNDRGTFGGNLFNSIVGTPISEEELLYKGLKREIRKLKAVY